MNSTQTKIFELIESLTADTQTARANIDRLELELHEARALPLGAAEVASRFASYAEDRAAVFAEKVDQAIQKAGSWGANGVTDVFFDGPGGMDSDGVFWLLGDAIQAAIEQRCRELMPTNGATGAERDLRAAKLEAQLEAERARLTELMGAIRRLSDGADVHGQLLKSEWAAGYAGAGL